MTLAADLMNVGFSWPAAQAEGYSSVAITAAGSTTANATVCDSQNKIFIMTATGSDGIRLNSSTPIGQPIFVVNSSASTGLLYPPTGGNFNGGTTDASISMATHKGLILIRVSTTLVISILTA